MNLTIHVRTRGWLASTLFSASLALALSQHTARGQAGNDNPTGPGGWFNGNVTTGGEYEPYTGSVIRTVTDLVIAGAAGEYGLSYSRTWNSRGNSGWHHSFSWNIRDVIDLPDGEPIPYTVSFPDGRSERFGPYAPPTSDTYWRAGAGVRERFKPLSSNFCYLLLPDGGQVEFSATSSSYYDGEMRQTYYSYYFTARAIIDPYGLRTSLSYYADGTLSKITEPAGRWIQLYYNAGRVEYIQGSDGRIVDYIYTSQTPGTIPYTLLTSVKYFNDASLIATYTYDKPNVGNAGGTPLLKSCDDPMYAGPMKKILYTYATSNNPDGTAPVYGQILSEKHPNGTPVSTLTINTATKRTEARGDGPVRTFNYSSGKLVNSTDFKAVPSSQTYDANGYVNSITDRRSNRTDFTNDPWTGNVTLTTHPLTAFDGGVRPTVQSVYGSATCPDVNNRDGNKPYYVYSVKNERSYTTFYKRNPNKRVIEIDYPNDAVEIFSYNPLGRVISHGITSGGTETFTYYGLSEYGGVLNGLLKEYRDPYHASGPASATFAYYTAAPSTGRVQSVTDAAGNRTDYQYNARGLVTRVTHPGGAYLQTGYNPDGTLAWTADENHPGAATDATQRTKFDYDDYKRVTRVTNPLNQFTDYGYLSFGTSSSYLHTSSAPFQVKPPGMTTHIDFDENFQRTIVRQAPGTADDAWTYFGYDPAGNMTSVQDPRGKVTTFGYDQRNRRTSATDPAPFNTQVTRWEYDAAGNMTKEIRPDSIYRRVIYDAMNRVIDTYGYANEHTGYRRDPAGNVDQITDPKNALYGFGYDRLNRKVSQPTRWTSAV